MIELCPSSGRKVEPDTMVRCVCGCFWYGKDYPETDGYKRKIVSEVPWHNVKGHIVDRDKWERRMRQSIESDKIVDHFKEINEDNRRLNVAIASEVLKKSKLDTKPRKHVAIATDVLKSKLESRKHNDT
jgi:hypothetical protein